MSRNLITVTEAAAVLGVTPQRVRQFLTRPEIYPLTAYRTDRVWLIDRASVQKFKRLKRPTGVSR